jgi:prepilin-type N-terminal cleavage/methylation domain-containing protein
MIKAANRLSSQAGYSLVEMMFVLAIGGILTGSAVLQMNLSRPSLKGDGGMRVVLSQLNQARELAITQRRNMRVTFTLGNKVEIYREKVTGETLTSPPCFTPPDANGCILSSTLIEGGIQFLPPPSTGTPTIGDTPDGFGKASAIDFGSATEMKFNPDGMLINQVGGGINGTVFIMLPNQRQSLRAVTVLGSTGRVRGYRWDGWQWKLV